MTERDFRIQPGAERFTNYPRDLVHEKGAKAGLLLHVAAELPDIPQAPMIVSHIGESNSALLRRADEAGIGWPRLIRSSAVAELDGYEGVLPTNSAISFEEWALKLQRQADIYPERGIEVTRERYTHELSELIDEVRYGPQGLSQQGDKHDLPDEINVIIAEKSSSKFCGTYIKHPNRDDLYLISLEWAANRRKKSLYSYTPDNGLSDMGYFSMEDIDLATQIGTVNEDLPTIISWHNRIAGILNSEWAYQIEYGADPACLFQVRPFKKIERAKFRLKEEKDPLYHPLLIGATEPEGIVGKALVLPERGLGNPIDMAELAKDTDPYVFFGDFRQIDFARYIPNLQANVLAHASGVLAHRDINAMRRARVTALYPAGHGLGINTGDWVRVISDGYNVEIMQIAA